MHIDVRKLENNSLIDGDVCIVGAGAAGISMALDWINTPYKVVLLESGGFEYEDRIQSLYAAKSTGQKYYPLKASRLSYFGGTTGHWAGMCSPFDNVDFIKRDWVPHSGWPITRKDLDPFYARANEKLKLGPYNYDYEYWNKQLSGLTPLPLDKEVIWNKMWQFSQARFGDLYKDAVTKAKNIHLHTYATLVDIVANDNVSSIRELTIKNYTGKTHRVRAKHFILAGGAIQNARMLLASNKQAKNGLGNDNDIVGRYFMEHLEIASADLWMTKSFDTKLYSWEYGVTKASAELAITEKTQIEHRILNGTASLSALSFGKNTKPRMETWQDEDPRKSLENMFKSWDDAAANAKVEKGNIERAFELNVRIEQAPNPNSRIVLSNETDELGVPRADLHWELTALDKRSIRKIFEIIGEQIGKTGMGRVRLREFLYDENDNSWPEGTNGGWHHMGTTRMSDDPKQGVVDANCQVHGIENLYVAGSGCYTTSGAPNPTLTLVALALRLSDHVKTKMNNV